ncbi:MAG: cupin domain-containing protein [Calditrichae bacterium]|nr:cupin domain-containing protein [Calditrichota bacterium]MCB9059552.1 cupin domain-containing protein [Calditrichia bacterium]
MPKEFRHIKKEDLVKKTLFPGGEVTFTHSNTMTLAEWYFEAGAIVPEHSHPHEQITKVLSGSFELTVAGTKFSLTEGSTGTIPSNIIHSGIALTDCHLIDIFHPVREDYK